MVTSYLRNNQSLIAEGIPPNDYSQIPEKYSEGEKDGKLNIEPAFPEQWSYWNGYCYGNREFWLKKKGIELPNEF